ncbi:MAG: hypothetical protein IPH05_03305 [Flavobacteriales bacterium]|nr:hypothetical protein [Flavobacteriales bacterium]
MLFFEELDRGALRVPFDRLMKKYSVVVMKSAVPPKIATMLCLNCARPCSQ